MNWNTAKKFLLTTSLGMVLASGARAEVVTLEINDFEQMANGSGLVSQPIVLEAGDTLEWIAAGSGGRAELKALVLDADAQNLGPDRSWSPSQYSDQRFEYRVELTNDPKYRNVSQLFYGPCKIQFSGYIINSGYRAFLTYRITRAAEEAGGGGAGAEAGSSVKIPEGATGDVQVVMESSEDGIIWVLAGPGPYPANGTRRQFRLRIINQ